MTRRIIINIVLLVAFMWFLLASIFAFTGHFAVPAVIIVFLLLFWMVNRILTKRLTARQLINKETAAIVFMAIAVCLSFQTYSQVIQKNIWFIKWNKTIAVNISPDLQSLIIAILLYSSVVIRRMNFKKFTTPAGILITCLNILFCTSFMKVFFSVEPWNIPFFNISSQSFVWIAIGLSWIGMSSIAGFVWIGLFFMAIYRLATVSMVMDSAGVVYALSAFLSILIQLSSVYNVKNVLEDFKIDFSAAGRHISSDMHSSAELAKDTAGNIAKTAVKIGTGL